jgi:MFS family permease
VATRLAVHPMLQARRIAGKVHTLDSLGYRDFRLLFITTMLASAGSWTRVVVVGWLTYSLTQSPLMTSMALGLDALPLLIISPLGGMLADMWDRRSILAVSIAFHAIAIGSMAVVVSTGHVETWHLFALILVEGTASAFLGPSYVSIVSSIVPKERLVNAFALTSLAGNSTRLIFPAIAGVILAMVGPAPALAMGAALFVAGGIFVLFMRVQENEPEPDADSSRKASFGESIGFVRSRPMIIAMIALTLLPLMLLGPFVTGLMPVYASEVYDVGPAGLGLLTSALGAGATLGIIVLASFGTIRNQLRVVIVTLALAGGAMAGFSLSPSILVSLPLLMLMSAAASISMTLGGAAVQSLTPASMRGRVSGIHEMTVGLFPLGTLTSGVLAQLLGAPTATIVAAGAMLVTLMALAFVFRGIWWRTNAPSSVASSD